MGKIIVIGSQKGGVGKTTTTLNLAYSLKELGKKVLTVDFDSQANLTTCYGVENTGALEYTIGHLMMDQMEEEMPENFEDYIQSRDGVDYLPSSIYLSVVDAKLRTEMGAERMLAEALEPLKSRYDYILIDTCPSLGMLTINAWEYEQKIDAKINRLVDLRAAINAAIESMENPEERLLLKYRYLKNESWEDISYELNVSYRTVHRIHASALNNFVLPE